MLLSLPTETWVILPPATHHLPQPGCFGISQPSFARQSNLWLAEPSNWLFISVAPSASCWLVFSFHGLGPLGDVANCIPWWHVSREVTVPLQRKGVPSPQLWRRGFIPRRSRQGSGDASWLPLSSVPRRGAGGRGPLAAARGRSSAALRRSRSPPAPGHAAERERPRGACGALARPQPSGISWRHSGAGH